MSDKSEATRLADALEELDGLFTVPGLCGEAAALLRRWPDGEPVGYLPAYELDRLRSGHDGRLRSAKFGPSALDGDIALYTAPHAESGRIAALEAALEQARGALEYHMAQTRPIQQTIDALRTIQGLQQ